LTAFFALWLAACNAPQVSQGQVTINILADGQLRSASVDAGSTVQEALAAAGVTINPLDRSDPPFYAIVTDGVQIRLTRVTEEFSQPVEEVIPFEQQEVRSESLPEGQMMISQKGVNGLRRIVYRRVLEEGQEISYEEWESSVVQKPVPEIILIGIGQTFAPMDIPGRIAYLMGGNAWVMDTNTGLRRLIVNSADLDGHVFELSPDGRWLLFTRRSNKPEQINALWLARADGEGGNETEISLDVTNVIHFAGFRPQTETNELLSYYTVAYSTVEQRTTAPGWQANNDLAYRGTSPSTDYVSDPVTLVDTNSGGAYGWWGTSFTWGPGGELLAYASPDAVGVVQLPADDKEDARMTLRLPIIPLETGSDWAWVPGMAFSPDGNVLYTVAHDVAAGVTTPDRSPLFDLVALPLAGGEAIPLARQVGMFAYPAPSPLLPAAAELSPDYQIAYLQAISPRESQASLYRLFLMDRDGSNQRQLFPANEARGLEPQKVVWSPAPTDENGTYAILVLYQGNLWIVNSATGSASQLTSDGLSTRVDWK
jgi:hypothetical protein